MPPQKCVAKLANKIQLNSKFVHYFFEYVQPAVIQHLAGQYVSMQVTETGTRRSYSICSSPAITHGFELLVDITPQGVGTLYLESLKFGQEVNLLAPLGIFTVAEGADEAAITFVATGAGVAPFQSMILDLLQVKHDTRPITLYWGLRDVEHVFWEAEFSELADNFPNFHFHPTLSQAPVEWPLCKGRVTNCLSIHDLESNAGYYICGNQTMVKDVSELLLTKGVTADRIHHEKFY